MTIRWSDMYDFVLPELPGIHVSLVDLHIRQTAIELCEETQIWVADLDTVDVVANTATYTLAPPTAVPETAVAMVKWVWYDNSPIPFSTLEELGQLSSYWPDVTAPTPSNYTQQSGDSLTLFPKPTVGLVGGIKMKAALAPSLAATGVPDWIGNKYIQEIANGAKAALFAMPGKPWSIGESAAYYRALYEAGKTRATIEANRSFTRANSQIQMRTV